MKKFSTWLVVGMTFLMSSQFSYSQEFDLVTDLVNQKLLATLSADARDTEYAAAAFYNKSINDRYDAIKGKISSKAVEDALEFVNEELSYAEERIGTADFLITSSNKRDNTKAVNQLLSRR